GAAAEGPGLPRPRHPPVHEPVGITPHQPAAHVRAARGPGAGVKTYNTAATGQARPTPTRTLLPGPRRCSTVRLWVTNLKAPWKSSTSLGAPAPSRNDRTAPPPAA